MLQNLRNTPCKIWPGDSWSLVSGAHCNWVWGKDQKLTNIVFTESGKYTLKNLRNTCYRMWEILVNESEKYSLQDLAWLVSAGVQTESGAWGEDQFPARRPQPLSQPTSRCITLYPKCNTNTITNTNQNQIQIQIQILLSDHNHCLNQYLVALHFILSVCTSTHMCFQLIATNLLSQSWSWCLRKRFLRPFKVQLRTTIIFTSSVIIIMSLGIINIHTMQLQWN